MLKPDDLAELIMNIGSVAAWSHLAASTIRYLLLVGTGGPARYVFCAANHSHIPNGLQLKCPIGPHHKITSCW